VDVDRDEYSPIDQSAANQKYLGPKTSISKRISLPENFVYFPQGSDYLFQPIAEDEPSPDSLVFQENEPLTGHPESFLNYIPFSDSSQSSAWQGLPTHMAACSVTDSPNLSHNQASSLDQSEQMSFKNRQNSSYKLDHS